MLRYFTAHPASVDETYGEHMAMALSFAGRLLVAALCVLVHAFLPFAFERTGSKIITRLYQRMVTGRHVKQASHNARVDTHRPSRQQPAR